MQKLIKRRMHPYLHPIGMTVRAYDPEQPPIQPPPPFPPKPRPPVSAPADGTRYTNPTPQFSGLLPNDSTHREAILQVAVDMGKGAIAGAATGIASGAGAGVGAAIGAGTRGTESIVTNCVNCHRRKN